MASRKTRAFTLVELLTVIAIIALLIGILVPAVQRAQRRAKEVAVQAQLDGIVKGLELFKADFGDYPASATQKYAGEANDLVQGSHRLFFALAGRDKQGAPEASPDSVWAPYYLNKTTRVQDNNTDHWGIASSTIKATRKGIYVDSGGFNTPTDNTSSDFNYMSLLCDKFSKKQSQPIFPAGSGINPYDGYNPILYFKANLAGGDNVTTLPTASGGIYGLVDNYRITSTDWRVASDINRILWGVNGDASTQTVKGGIVNKSGIVGDIVPPANRESYLLISAGFDTTFFTEDDVVNWSK